jgi:hypothetical protein
MGYKSIIQIVLFITSVVIIVTYIQPSLLTIKETQDEIFVYSDASGKASELNVRLSSLTDDEQSFKSTDMAALSDYLPSTIDVMAVMADVASIVKASDATITALGSGELQLPNEDAVFAGEVIVSDSTPHIDIDLSVSATYESFKTMLRSFEKNKYPLEVVSLTLGESTRQEGDLVTSADDITGTYDLVLRTYSYSDISN